MAIYQKVLRTFVGKTIDIMHLRFRTMALMWMILMACQAVAASSDVAISLYSRWENLPSERLMQMGEQYRKVTRQPDSALVCFSIVANRYYQGHRSHDDIAKAIEAMTHITWLYMDDFYDYPKAVSYNLRAKELAEQHQILDYMPFILNNDAVILGLLDSYENKRDFSADVINLHKRSFALAFQDRLWYAMYVSYINMVMRTVFVGKEELIENEMSLIKRVHPSDSVTHFKYARCLTDGIIARRHHQLDSAIVYFKHLLEISQEFGLSGQTALSKIIANDFLFLCYGEMGLHEQALFVVEANEALAKQENMQIHLMDAYSNLSNFYRYNNNTQLAEHYHLLYLEANVALLTDQKLGKANAAKFLYEIDKKNEQVRELAVRDQMKSRVLWGSLAFAAILMVLLVLLWLNYRRVQENNRQLYEKSLEMLRADEEKRQLIKQLQSAPTEVEAEPPCAPDEAQQRKGKLSETRQSDLLHRIFYIMETCDEIYSPDFTLPRLAELVGDTRNNVSEAINLRYKDNFNGLLNEYRIKEACRRINDRSQWGDLTLEAIGQSVGFKSRSTFWTAFKQFTGLTPGAYQRQSL